MSRHLHDGTTLYYITFFIKRYINKTSSFLLKDTGHLPSEQYNYTLSQIRRITTNIFNSGMRLVRQRLHGFISPRPPLMLENKYPTVVIIFSGAPTVCVIQHVRIGCVVQQCTLLRIIMFCAL